MVVKLNIKNIKVEQWNKFKEEFNSWKTYEERAWKEYITNGNETDLTIEEINATMEQYKTNLNNYSPKELKDCNDYQLFVKNDHSYQLHCLLRNINSSHQKNLNTFSVNYSLCFFETYSQSQI